MCIAGCDNCKWIGQESELLLRGGEEYCPSCGHGDRLTEPIDADRFSPRELDRLWDLFGNIPLDSDECIKEEFIGFPPGTLFLDVWGWFEHEGMQIH